MATAKKGIELVGVGHAGTGGVDVGEGCRMSEWQKLRWTVHTFATLPQGRGNSIRSSELECHGHKWRLEIYPGGESQQDHDFGFVSFYLGCPSANNINHGDRCVLAELKVFLCTQDLTKRIQYGVGLKYSYSSATHYHPAGWDRFMKRRDLVKDFLWDDGSLVFEVEIRIRQNASASQKKAAAIWTPSNTVCADMLKMLDSADGDNSNVIFEVGKATKKKKKGKELFHAHRNIILTRAPILASLTEDIEDGTPIPVEDMDPGVFRKILRFVYGGEVPPKDVLKDEARTLIQAADRFGVTGLKLSAEAELASSSINAESCAELILFADGTNCAMLKEAAVDFFVAQSVDVMKSDGYEQIEQSPTITKELMLAMAAGSKKRPASGTSSGDIKRMRVSALRQELENKGLDVDGSKDMLVARLENAMAGGDDDG